MRVLLPCAHAPHCDCRPAAAQPAGLLRTSCTLRTDRHCQASEKNSMSATHTPRSVTACSGSVAVRRSGGVGGSSGVGKQQQSTMLRHLQQCMLDTCDSVSLQRRQRYCQCSRPFRSQALTDAAADRLHFQVVLRMAERRQLRQLPAPIEHHSGAECAAAC